MEAPTYRLELESINNRFGGKQLLSQKEVCDYLGRAPLWVRENLGIHKDGITAVKLAYVLSHR